eukprot:EG_transcript_2070
MSPSPSVSSSYYACRPPGPLPPERRPGRQWGRPHPLVSPVVALSLLSALGWLALFSGVPANLFSRLRPAASLAVLRGAAAQAAPAHRPVVVRWPATVLHHWAADGSLRRDGAAEAPRPSPRVPRSLWLPGSVLTVLLAGMMAWRRQATRLGASAIAMATVTSAKASVVPSTSYMDILRGRNLNDDAFAKASTRMTFVEVRAGPDSLPQYYDFAAIKEYFGRRPGAVALRLVQVFVAFSGLAAAYAAQRAQGRADEPEYRRRRAALLCDIVTELGPFFIKFGQALSIRPDVLSQEEMEELQKLCDKVPPFDSAVAMNIIRQELGPPEDLFSEMTPEPVAAASLGQVYQARLRKEGTVVAVKVQRPFVLETVALDLYLVRLFGTTVKGLKFLKVKSDLTALVDEFASRFYGELDYRLECQNGLRIAEDLKGLANVVIPKVYPEYTTRRIHTNEWIEGEKLAISRAANVGELVSLGTVAYLTQLLGTGLFHADPHPGNLIRTHDGKLAILDFGLMTEINDEQKFGFIEAIAHLVHRDYEKIGDDFVHLGFLPDGTDVRPLLPVLARVFDMALQGGGAKGINFNQLAGDLAKITYDYPFRIPPFLALVIRAIGVLEGIALVGNPDFAIIRAAYPYISERLLTDQSPRMQETLRYLIYGKDDVFNVRRVIDLLENVDTYTAVSTGTMEEGQGVRDALIFMFSEDGEFIRTLLLKEVATSLDAMNRNALYELARRVGLRAAALPSVLVAAAPGLSPADLKAIENLELLINFTLGNLQLQDRLEDLVSVPRAQKFIATVTDTLPEIAPGLSQFGVELLSLLSQKLAARLFRFTLGVTEAQQAAFRPVGA